MEQGAQVNARIGQVIGGRYRLIKLIGVGGMGEVYEAVHQFTYRRVAVKVVHGWIARTSPDVERRFFAEAEAAVLIEHDAIVEVLDAGKEPNGTLFLVFELLEGEDMEAALRDHRVRPSDLVRIATHLLDVLAATHAAGLVHRDIKPANIFLARGSEGLEVKLLDFGIAKPIRISSGGGLTNHGSIVGTVEYMSPEQAAGKPLDGRSDLWALAALMFRGFTGRPPYFAENHNLTIVKLMTEDAPSLADFRPDLPEALIEVIDRALRRDPNQRFANAEEMVEALRACELRDLEDLTSITHTPGQALGAATIPEGFADTILKQTLEYGAVELAAAMAQEPGEQTLFGA